jgi:predicted flap endonuclease-1-like 5' DNA nuclease
MVFVAALGALAAATAGLALLVDPVLTWYYHLAWWSYIVAADAANRRMCGRSLLRDEPRRFWALAGGSVAWWTLFEAINLRLGNWYYVMDPASRAVRWTGGVVAFATVLPGIVETLQLLENAGVLRSLRVAPLRWGPGKERLVLALGAACFILPLLWPDLFFPLTWGSFVLLIEPWNRRHARRSFLRDLEQGEAAPFVRTLAAGLACGLLWETWNYWTRTKWIYTVPGFERFKLFEMPLLGFLGFPPFAVECLVVIRAAQALAARLEPRRRPPAAAAAVVAAGLFTLAVFAGVDPVTVDSFYAPTARLEAIPSEARRRLDELGLRSPERLRRALHTAEDRAAWSARSGLPAAELEDIRSRVELVMHRGLGQERAAELERLGVETVADLARWDPAALAAAMRARETTPRDRFLERRARVWIDAAAGAARSPAQPARPAR